MNLFWKVARLMAFFLAICLFFSGPVLAGEGKEQKGTPKVEKRLEVIVKIWSKGKADVAKNSEKDDLKLATLISAPRIVTFAGQAASVSVSRGASKSSPSDTLFKIQLKPVILEDGLVKMDLNGEIALGVNNDSTVNPRKWNSVFTVKMGKTFFFPVPGNAEPRLVIETTVRPYQPEE